MFWFLEYRLKFGMVMNVCNISIGVVKIGESLGFIGYWVWLNMNNVRFRENFCFKNYVGE